METSVLTGGDREGSAPRALAGREENGGSLLQAGAARAGPAAAAP